MKEYMKQIINSKYYIYTLFFFSGLCTLNAISFFNLQVNRYDFLSYAPFYYNLYRGLSHYSWYFMRFFPIVVSVPAGLSIYRDYKCGLDIIHISKLGKKRYYFNKFFSIFISTFLLFFVPVFLSFLVMHFVYPGTNFGGSESVQAHYFF